MNWFRKFFGNVAPADGAIHLYVRCKRCGAPIHVRIDPRNELTIEYSDDEQPSGYQLIKEIMDDRCFRLMRAELKARALESLEKARAARLCGQQHEAFVYADWAASDRRRAAWFGAAIAKATGEQP